MGGGAEYESMRNRVRQINSQNARERMRHNERQNETHEGQNERQNE
jgi:hypothetical protein